jgi:hypothetical protein
VHHAADEKDIFYFVIAVIAVTLEKSVESFQEMFWIIATSSWLILVHHDSEQTIRSCSVDSHI